mgnify:CR=1
KLVDLLTVAATLSLTDPLRVNREVAILIVVSSCNVFRSDALPEAVVKVTVPLPP